MQDVVQQDKVWVWAWGFAWGVGSSFEVLR